MPAAVPSSRHFACLSSPWLRPPLSLPDARCLELHQKWSLSFRFLALSFTVVCFGVNYRGEMGGKAKEPHFCLKTKITVIFVYGFSEKRESLHKTLTALLQGY